MMKLKFLVAFWAYLVVLSSFAADIFIPGESGPGKTKPILVSVSGISGEALQTLQLNLYIQGFAFTNAEAAQFSFSGSANGSLQGRVIDNVTKKPVLSKAYSGASIRRQTHAFVDDFVKELGRTPICQTKIAFKNNTGPNSDNYISDLDGHNTQPVTQDSNIMASPEWAPGKFGRHYG